MKIYRSIEDYDEDKRSVVTIGTFDGIHLGHKKILSRLIKSSKNKDLNSVVLTFFPHPRIILNKYNEVKMIDTLDEKIIHLNEIGIDSLVIHPFDKNFSLLSANQFIKDFLVDKLKIKHIIIGYDHRFGKGREASVTDLKNYADDYDFTVEEIKAQEIEKITVSSTKIRNSINQGDIKTTEKYLGRYFNLTGKVVKGDGLGKKINYPTANIFIEETYKIIPKDGVYLVENLDPTYDTLEKYFNKWKQLEEPEFHENGRKKRITKDRIKKIKNYEALYWKEHYRLFPNDRPKVKKKRRKRNS